MTVETLRNDVSRLLADADQHIKEAEALLANGTGRERVNAAGDLVTLKHQKAALEARLADIDHAPHNTVAGLLQRIREEGMVLRENLAALVTM